MSDRVRWGVLGAARIAREKVVPAAITADEPRMLERSSSVLVVLTPAPG